jgi:hypothetical protein
MTFSEMEARTDRAHLEGANEAYERLKAEGKLPRSSARPKGWKPR